MWQPCYLQAAAVLGAWLCFGTFAVPLKWRSVADAQVHPLVYQSYKTFWTFVTAHGVLFFEYYHITGWGIVSGILWVPAGIAAVVAVRNIGLACGQAIWQTTAIGTAFLWGFGILRDEEVSSWGRALAAAGLLLCGLAGMTCAAAPRRGCGDARLRGISGPEKREEPPESPWPNWPRPLQLVGPWAAAGVRLLEEAPPAQEARRQTSTAVGLGAAVFNGIWGGANLVPSHYAPFHGVHFALSFATGALLVNALLLAGYALLARLWWRIPMPAPHLRVMAVPGFLSGSLWSLGNFCSLYCVQSMGQGIGYSLVQASSVVSGAWGILYYREITGWAALGWALCCAMCLLGCMLLKLQQIPAL